MEHIGDADDEPVDSVAASRALEQDAERILAAGGLDDAAAREIRIATEQLAADRANGENPDDSLRRLRDLLDRVE